jgi:hypothetical protein
MNIVSQGLHHVKVWGRRTVVCDVVLPMGKLPSKGVPKMFEREAHSEFLGYMGDDPISEECPRFRFGAVTDGEDLERHSE